MSARNSRKRARPIALAAIPTADGASNAGAVLGPHALIEAGLPAALQARGRTIDRIATLSAAPGLGVAVGPEPIRAHNAASIAATARAVSDAALALMRDGTLPVFLGGDHSIAIGSIDGVARYCAENGRELFVLWLDAHADYNTPDTSPTGNMHGMALAMLSGEPGFAPLFERKAWLEPGRTLLMGTRALDPLEYALVRRRDLEIVGIHEIATFGLRIKLQQFFERVRLANGVLHVSFDVDVLDPVLAPGVGTPVPGGLSGGHACQIFDMLRASGLVRSLDVVELDPTRDSNGRTASTVVRLVSGLFGTGHVRRTRIAEETSHDRNAA